MYDTRHRFCTGPNQKENLSKFHFELFEEYVCVCVRALDATFMNNAIVSIARNTYTSIATDPTKTRKKMASTSATVTVTVRVIVNLTLEMRCWRRGIWNVWVLCTVSKRRIWIFRSQKYTIFSRANRFGSSDIFISTHSHTVRHICFPYRRTMFVCSVHVYILFFN